MTATVPKELLADFLARMDRGEIPDFEALLHAHPEHAAELRKLFQEECEKLEASGRTLPLAEASRRRNDASACFSAEIVARLSGRGASFGRYSIRGEIGKGGMGAVLRVWDEDLRRELAMKVTLDDASGLAGSSEASKLARFLEEAQVTGQLDHPGIVPVHELGLDLQGRVYFTMKLVKGRTFAQVLDLVRDGKDGWTQARALGVIQRVCEAMAYAHDKGVLHRDLKPANVMVGAFGEVYVMDWGLARIVGAEDRRDIRIRTIDPVTAATVGSDRAEHRGCDPSSSLLTMDGQVVGTPAYMPPEQAAGKVEEVGPHSDVYAVGAMIYHLLAGRPPYVGTRGDREDLATWQRVQAGPPAPLPLSATAELAAICEKAMARDWRARYRDMAGMAADLSAFLEGRVVHAYETGALAEAKKWVRRNRGFAAALGAALLALVSGLLATLALKARADEHSLRAEKIASFLEETLGGVRPSVARGHDTAMLREMMDAAWARIESGELSAAPEAELRLTWLIGNAYREIARYDLAEPVLRKAVERGRAQLSGDDPYLAWSLSDLALVLADRGGLEEAEQLATEALEMSRRLFPGNSPDVAARIGNLASVTCSSGDLEGCERLYRETLEMHERLHSGDHESIAEDLQNLGFVLKERGELSEAEVLFRRSLEMFRRRFQGDHPSVATGLNNLGALFSARGDPAGAEVLYFEALGMRKRLFPGDHPELATSLDNLAVVRQARGDLAGAEPLVREAIEMRRRLFPGDHAAVANSLENLGALHQARGDLAGAEPIHREALEMRRRLFPGDHADIAVGLNNLAMLLKRRGDLQAAEPAMRESLEMLERLLPGDHPRVAMATGNFALLLEARGDLTQAEAVYRKALKLARAALPASHPATVRSAIGLGSVLLARESFADAEEVLTETASFLRDSKDDAAKDRERCLELLVNTFAAWERSEPGVGHDAKAESWKKELADLRGR